MSSATTTAYQLCPGCAVAYSDMKVIDTERSAEVVAFLAEAGYLVPAEDIDPPGYWLCECCGLDQLGADRTFTR
ncbi:hypothetical protein WDY80_24515 (plasmid) [Gordonia hongkongensis]|uniref:hypothetical protein n=1 Tax=Gordonia hongkongensis TaxID=1701090 RepID=UPI0030CF77BB